MGAKVENGASPREMHHHHQQKNQTD